MGIYYVSLIEDIAMPVIAVYGWQKLAAPEEWEAAWILVAVTSGLMWITKVSLFVWSKLKYWIAHLLLKYYGGDDYDHSDHEEDWGEFLLKLFYNLNTLWNLVTNFWYTLENLMGELQDQAQDAQQQAQ